MMTIQSSPKPAIHVENLAKIKGENLEINTAYNAAVADAGVITVWTPTSGNKFYLKGFVVSSDAAGRLVLLDQSATLANFVLGNSGICQVDFGDWGILSAAANNLLRIQNSSGAAVELAVAAWGLEVT